MSVNICRGGEVTVTQPFLDFLHGYPIFQQQTGTGMSEVMEANLPQPVLSEHDLKVLCDKVGGIRNA